MEGSTPGDGNNAEASLIDAHEKRPRASSTGSKKLRTHEPHKRPPHSAATLGGGGGKPASVRPNASRQRMDTPTSSQLGEVDSVPSLRALNVHGPRQQQQQQQHRSSKLSPKPLEPIPTTFNQEPQFVRRLSVSLNTEVSTTYCTCTCMYIHDGNLK